MELEFLGRGFVIGLAIAAPVGAIGLLCIRRTLAEGRQVGFVSGLGAATADAAYGAVAALGLTAVSSALVSYQPWIRLVGGLYLCYLGFRIAGSRPGAEAAAASARGLLQAYLSTLALTLTNPTTILSFVAIFAGLGLAGPAGDPWSAALLVLGVFTGSAAWWFLLSGAVGFLRLALTPARLGWVNRISGAALVGLGLLALLSLLPGFG
ncbi:MAG: LysE family transporter [Chloroflexota bacterium]|nr:LysE family transporter [Chloroflexota bacterium]